MVPIALDFARAHLNRGDRNESTVFLAMTELHSCYQCLRYPSILGGSPHCMWHWKRQEWNLSAFSRNFTFFQELAEMDGCQPALSWTYRDEDFGGTVAGLVRRRGGPRTIAATGSQVLQRFVGRHQVPVLT